MKKIVFYSWQSDLPNSTNRGFIQKALESAASNIVNDDSVSIEPVIDRDTHGVAGAPDIASTIFAKIVATDIFIADVSIINNSKDGRNTPNPNVLIELGYALKSLGHERVVLVFNNSFGDIKDLPFDLRTRRVITYNMPEKSDDRSAERKKLESDFEKAVRAVMEKVPTNEPISEIPAIKAIESGQLNKLIVLRDNLKKILEKIDSFQPQKHSEGGTIDDLTKSIEQTQELVAEFSKITEIAVVIGDAESILEIYKWLGNIFEKYYYSENYSGKTSTADFDYFKFIGHELFVTLVSFLIREKKWDILKNILHEPIPVKYIPVEHGPGNIEWVDFHQSLPLLQDEGHKSGRISVQADILSKRHVSGGLSSVLPFEEIIAADFFLWMLVEIPPAENQSGIFDWSPRSCIYMKYTPMFIKNAEYTSVAKQIIDVFNMSDIKEFKKRFLERISLLTMSPLSSLKLQFINLDIKKIGTR